MNTKFAVGVHSLLHISQAEEASTSESIAKTLNTNAGYVRRVLSGLAKAGLISSASKSRGCSLLRAPDDITLADVYNAVEPDAAKLNMDLSRNPDTSLILCECEQPVMGALFAQMEEAVDAVLRGKTLQDVIDKVRQVEAERA